MIFGIPPTGQKGLTSEPEWQWFVHMVRMYAAMVHDSIHFAEGSYGDGEWHAILGDKGHTANGQIYEPWLGDLLRRTLMEPRGQWCSYWGSLDRPLRQRCDTWLRENNPPVIWFARRPLGGANSHGWMVPLFQAFQTRRCILVGPKHLRKLDKRVLPHFIHVEVSNNRAYEEMERVKAELEFYTSPGDLILFSCGLAAPVLIWDLLPEWGRSVTLWDVGAIFDPYCGVFSRKNYAKKEWQEKVMPRNIP